MTPERLRRIIDACWLAGALILVAIVIARTS